MANELVLYDAMLAAVANCYSVDEIKQIHDQAAAFEAAAKVAMNTDAERKCIEIRVRAERRAGELLRELRRTPPEESGRAGGQGAATVAGPSEYADTIKRTGIKERTARRWQQLAELPPELFDKHMEAEQPPSTATILKPKPKRVQLDCTHDALWLWGRLRDFEREFLERKESRTALRDLS